MAGAIGDGGKYSAKEWMKSHEIERIDIVKTVDSMGDTGVTFTVPDLSVKGKSGEVATITFVNPLDGNYNTTNDMGFISTAGMKSSDIAIRPIITPR